MKLPQHLLSNTGFLFDNPDELLQAIGTPLSLADKDEIRRLFAVNLPPIISPDSLSVMFGYNPGFVYSMMLNPSRHYRHFTIPKGREERSIDAPKVALKGVQKWLSHHFQNVWTPLGNVHGFVRGRSHISAASTHLGAKWVASIDIENFFPSVHVTAVEDALRHIGYRTVESCVLISRLICLDGKLVQGAPTSPVISNLVLRNIDEQLASYCSDNGFTYTRYADDIVVSGQGEPPEGIINQISRFFVNEHWRLSERKTSLDVLPNRLKVHGLLVHGEKLRLTKGYRNRLRAYNHLLPKGKISEDDLPKVLGHICYGKQVDAF